VIPVSFTTVRRARRVRLTCEQRLFGIVVNACMFCGRWADGQFSLHRDGFSVGPELPLCSDCGGHETPTLGEIWDYTALPGVEGGYREANGE
jgi:hypothetical protein